MNTPIYVSCIVILLGIILAWPKAIPPDTLALRRFGYTLRTFGLAAILLGILKIVSIVGAHNAYFSEATLNKLSRIRLSVGGIGLGVILATFVSGQQYDYFIYWRTMRAKKKELKKARE